MPSRDPHTGKRLGGTAIKKRRELREIAATTQRPAGDGLPVPLSLLGLPPPPDRGVCDVEAWAAQANLRTAQAMQDANEYEAPRLFAVAQICKELGKLQARALRAEKAMRLRRLRLDGDDVVDLASPPYDDPVAIPLWAFHRLAQLAYEAATSSTWLPDVRILASVKVLAASGYLPVNAAIQAVADRVKAQG